MSSDPIKFGLALRQIRERKNIAQKELLARIPHRYSDPSSYRRIERGERCPDRQVIIEILTAGLDVTDGSTVDELLALAGYDGLSELESEQLGIRRAALSITQTADGPGMAEMPRTALATLPDERLSPVASLTLACVAGGCLILVTLLCWWAHVRPVWFVIVTAAFYAGLYSVSILLETAYHRRTVQIQRLSVLTFCFIVVCSVAAFATDSLFIAAKQANGLWVAIAVILLAGGAQWMFARRFLSPEAIVPATFQPHTGQSAHLKNTIYFSIIVVTFWLPPWHSVAILERHLNSSRAVPSIRTGPAGAILFIDGIPCPNPNWLWGLFVVLVLVAIAMRSQLIDNLKPHPFGNRYLILFYARALLYFSLSALCVFWYSLAMGNMVV
jgi:transcriptional regulator with XRE-family HTH domain